MADVGRGAETAAVGGYHSRETVGVVDVAFGLSSDTHERD